MNQQEIENLIRQIVKEEITKHRHIGTDSQRLFQDISSPTGGSTVDSEARAVINKILSK